MNKKSIIVAVIIGLILLALPFIFYFSTKISEGSALPKPITHTNL
ncbi:hypothetical protein MHB84_08320 [Paenibacillus sp. FSL F4-0087]|nr:MULTISPECIES: hypothetical protein [unclassified Paenibacillus]